MNFDLLSYASSRTASGNVKIRRPTENSPLVPDEDADGAISNQCSGDEYHLCNEWGNRNYGKAPDFNIQNQSDVGDLPCFANYYITFPISDVLRNKVIITAKLSLYQFGNSGGPGEAICSWIQVLTTQEDLQENSITWNNAPLAFKNFDGSWVKTLPEHHGFPGIERKWDVSYAIAKAHLLSQSSRLVLYSADSDYHSAKYFISSNTGDWNVAGRPRLDIRWGEF